MIRGLPAVIGIGLLLRLLTFWLMSPTPPHGDETEYSFRAVAMASGETIPGGGKRPPGSIWFYAGAHRLFGPDPAVARLANTAVSLLTIPLVWVLGMRLGGRRVALIAAALAAVYPSLLLYAPSLWSEALYNALSLGALVLLVPREGAPHPAAALAAGVLMGAAALTREVGILLPAVAVAALVPAFRGAAWRPVAALAAGFVVTLAPWTVNQNRDAEAFTLVSRTTWKNMYLGNAPMPDGTERSAQRRGAGVMGKEFTRLGRSLQEREAAAKEIALQSIRDRMPLWPVEKTLEMVPALVSPNNLLATRLRARPDMEGWAGAWAYDTTVDGTAAEPLRDVYAWAAILAWVALAAAGTAGLGLAAGRRPAGLFLAFIAFHVAPTLLTFAITRFRMPFVPLLLITAAWLFVHGREAWSGASAARRSAVVAATAIALVAIAVRWPLLAQLKYG